MRQRKMLTSGINSIKRDIRLYNVAFPVWMLWLVPQVFLICAVANLIIDGAVVLISSKVLKFFDIIKKNIKCIFLVWIFGFLADFAGTIFLFGISQLFYLLNDFTKLGGAIAWGISYNPFGHPLAFFITFAAIVLSGYLIFLLNYYITFKKLDISQKQKKTLALILALATAPYLFLLPMGLFY